MAWWPHGVVASWRGGLMAWWPHDSQQHTWHRLVAVLLMLLLSHGGCALVLSKLQQQHHKPQQQHHKPQQQQQQHHKPQQQQQHHHKPQQQQQHTEVVRGFINTSPHQVLHNCSVH
ncbi:hypothetical protein FHG87_017322 [Trinorchestia longiramus]|nr:hypothetical protein FHG87_017322 [Trinorchestia longiramus]